MFNRFAESITDRLYAHSVFYMVSRGEYGPKEISNIIKPTIKNIVFSAVLFGFGIGMLASVIIRMLIK